MVAPAHGPVPSRVGVKVHELGGDVVPRALGVDGIDASASLSRISPDFNDFSGSFSGSVDSSRFVPPKR